MRAVFLDIATLDRGDLQRTELQSIIPECMYYDYSHPPILSSRVTNVEIIITNKVAITEKILLQAKALKLICIAATGMNNVDVNMLKQQGIVLCNVLDYAKQSVAQHVIGLIISLLRNFPAYHHAITQKHWQSSPSFCLLDHTIDELSDKTLGIIGYGVLGQAVERIASCLGMRVLIAERHKPLTKKTRPGRTEFTRVLVESDIISLHCPLTPQTKALIAKKELSLMKNTAILINTARGGIVDEVALLDALQQGTIAGAALDVLEVEPPDNVNALFDESLSNHRLIITPHIAWASRQARQTLLNKIAQNIQFFQSGCYQNLKNFYF